MKNAMRILGIAAILFGSLLLTAGNAPETVNLLTFGQQGARKSGAALDGVRLTPGTPGGFFTASQEVAVHAVAQFEFEFQSSVPGSLRFAAGMKKGGQQAGGALPPLPVPGDGEFHKVIFELADLPNWKEFETLTNFEIRFIPSAAGAEAVVGFRNARFTCNPYTSAAEKAHAALAAEGQIPVELLSFGQVGPRVKGYAFACKLQPGKPGGAFRTNDQMPVGEIDRLTLEFRSSVPGSLRLAAGLVLKDGKNASGNLPAQTVPGGNAFQTCIFELDKMANFGMAKSFKEIELRFTPNSAEAAEIEFKNAAFRSSGKVVAAIASQWPPVFKKGEPVNFEISAKQGRELVRQGRLTVEFTNSGKQLLREEVVDFSKANPAKLNCTMTEPGILFVRGKSFADGPQGVAVAPMPTYAAAFSPEEIQPGVPEPADFMEFWQEGLARVKDAPVTVSPLPGKTYPDHDPFLVTVQMPGNEPFYAAMLIPKAPGKYPVWIHIPGAGPGGVDLWFGPNAAKRILVCMHVHKYAPSADRQEMLRLYKEYNAEHGLYCLEGAADRETFFYRRVFLGMSRVVDYLCTRPEWDGKNVVVSGGSQGGASTMALAALNPHVTVIGANIPAMCDHYGWKVGRAPGWPELHQRVPGSDQTALYYDTVNFARHVKAPAFVSVGFLDVTAPAAGGYAAFNRIPGEKEMLPMYLGKHEVPPECNKAWNVFEEKHLK